MSQHAVYATYPKRIVIPHTTHLAYEPAERKLLCALFYFNEQRHAYGWWIGARGAAFESSYFMLENFYSDHGTRFFATRGGDLYGGWVFDYARESAELADTVPAEGEFCHRLEALQSEFAAEWLFFRDDPAAAAEVAEYEKAGLMVRTVNLQIRHLGRLERHGKYWTYSSHDADGNLIDYLRQSWPLDYRFD